MKKEYIRIKYLLLATLLLFGICTNVIAGFSRSKIFDTDQYEELTATGVDVVQITPGIISTTSGTATQRAYIKVTGQGIRWLCDGTTPSTSLGNPTSVNEWFQLVGTPDITGFRFVNDDDTGTSTCHVNLQVNGVQQP